MGSMKGLEEQRGLFSRLPEDPEYWHNFTGRIVADAVPDLESFAQSGREWWSEIARFSTLLAVGASAAVFALVFLIGILYDNFSFYSDSSADDFI